MKRWVSSEWKDRKQCMKLRGFPGGASGEEPACRCRRHKASSLPGLGRYPGIGHSSPLQYSCLENPMDRGALWATVHGVAESDTTEATEHKTYTVPLSLTSG